MNGYHRNTERVSTGIHKRRDDGAGGCYTIPMGLCYDCGFRALTVALALGLPGDYSLPSGELEGDLRASLFTASESAVERAAASSRRAGP